MELPRFKYSPNAYEIDVFTEEEGICSICSVKRNLKYTGSFYSIEEPEYICPWCINDGSVSKKYNGEFNDYSGIENVSPDPSIQSKINISEKHLLEVCERTPSYVSWQQEVWLTHCNEPCAFIGYANNKIIEPFLDELKEDIEVNIGYDPELIRKYLTTDGSLVGYLFQCVNCGQHRLHADSD
ncbi:CbrC family protein [Flavobacterium sp. N502540]|uniref:CbrC family protein n=1 Tax=Flavobacterium sp. N502540 TaxID=2986838 RepID=UPI0022256B24|nr:CbrC family protein [Flavobacterium sp. N502540]